ncbi:MAG: sodium:solute symporter family protein [Desulfuromonadales bacterium]|nr:sodium:solute symporter family protein [Desulfuromonadales bacterium]NIR33846.1 sodium:solute symporter family protein [Desulfuromonadales bacterium]NIS42526.1 sodium:solute symporter family protein [Desulfuromonadales bacterium]
MALTAVRGGGKPRSAEHFTLAGRQAGSWLVGGAIMGTLVGGASTIGTVQMAFLFGLSGWWFTLGAGLACLCLGLFLAAPLRESEVETIPQFIARRYGERTRLAASLFSAAGMFVHIVAQLLAASAILTTLLDLSFVTAALLSTGLIALVSVTGGMRSAGPFGLAKLLLLYLTMLTAGIFSLRLAGGWSGLTSGLPDFPWFSLFGYGRHEGLSDLLSMLVGVISTQTYLQAVFSARDRRAARNGALISAALIPPLGLLGVAVGMFMRLSRPEIDSSLALPTFIIEHLPPAFGGVAFAALLIAAVGTASGLVLGVGTTVRLDMLRRWRPNRPASLGQLRWLTLAVLALAVLLLIANLGTAILEWSFLSMGLRGATLCLPLLAAIFCGRSVSPAGGALAIVVGPTSVIVAGLAQIEPVPPLYIGLAASLACLLLGRFMPSAGRRV